jgi:hypothetical protein
MECHLYSMTFMLSVIHKPFCVEYRYAECRYAECRSAKVVPGKNILRQVGCFK